MKTIAKQRTECEQLETEVAGAQNLAVLAAMSREEQHQSLRLWKYVALVVQHQTKRFFRLQNTRDAREVFVGAHKNGCVAFIGGVCTLNFL